MKIIWHALLAIFYVFQIIALLLFLDVDLERSLDVTFLSRNLLTDNLETTVKTIYNLRISHALTAILALTAVWHLRFAFGSKLQLQVIEQKINVWRWLIGGILLGAIAALTALVFGNSDLSYLILILSSGVAYGWLGLLREYLLAQQPRQGTSPRATNKLFWQISGKLVFSLQKISLIIPWLLIGVSLLASYFWAQDSVDPDHYFIFGMGLALALAWLFNTLSASQKFAQWRSYAFADGSYFVAHGILFSAWVWMIALLGV